jgi:hypothetical protein
MSTARETAPQGYKYTVRVELTHVILAVYNQRIDAERFTDSWNAEHTIGKAYIDGADPLPGWKCCYCSLPIVGQYVSVGGPGQKLAHETCAKRVQS